MVQLEAVVLNGLRLLLACPGADESVLDEGRKVALTLCEGRHPGPRATEISPAQHGDGYTYCVDKYWVVDKVPADGTVLIRTRRGKTRRINPRSQELRRPTWWERLRYASRFPTLT